MTMRKILLVAWLAICGLLGLFTLENSAFSDTPKAGAAPADVDVTDFNDWRFACSPAEKNAAKECRIFQRVSWGKDKNHQASMSVILFAVSDRAAAASKSKEKPVLLMRVVMPLGVDLRAGLGMVIGKGGKQVSIPYGVCLPAGCVATIGLVSQIADKIKSADGVTIAYKMPGAPKGTGIKISTKGFGSASEALIKAKKS